MREGARLAGMLLVCSAVAVAAEAGLEREYSAAGVRKVPIAGVDRIYYSGPGTLRLRQGDRPSLVIRGAPPAVEGVVIDCAADALYIDVPGSGAGLTVEATVPTVSEVVTVGRNVVVGDALTVEDLTLEGNGAGSFRLSGLRADELLVTGYGDAAFTISGTVDRQVLDLQGDGHYQARNLMSRSVEAKISGTGVILLAVEELLDVTLAGAASVRYAGSPFVSQIVSGPGSVQPVAELSI